ncbi:MAG: type II and III secretion system protein family protein [Nitrospinota bacterium]
MRPRACSLRLIGPFPTLDRGLGALLALALLAGVLHTGLARAQEGQAPARVPPGNTLFVTVGKSSLIDLPYSLGRLSVTNPDTADALVIGPNQVLVNGKTPGITNLILWSRDNRSIIYDVVVQGDIEVLMAKLRALLPKENFRVLPAQDSLILSGITQSPEAKAKAAKVAEAFAPKKVVNLIRVAPDTPQVMLKVHFAEVGAQALKRLGFQFFAFAGGAPGLDIDLKSGRGDLLLAPGSPVVPLRGSYRDPSQLPDISQLSALVNFFISNPDQDVGLLINALKENNDLRTLAEPRLVTVSGKKASFHAGGEIPVPVPADGNVAIEWKTFGIKLEFTPTVREDGRIELELTPEVSDLDPARGVTIAGGFVPALRTRRATTKVELRNGQTFAIAGLIDNSVSQTISKFPLLGDLPIIGALFRSKRFDRRETELLVIITPEVVRPRGPEEPLVERPGFALGRGM